MSITFSFMNDSNLQLEDSMNLNNANAEAFIRMLGLDVEDIWDCEPFPIEEVEQAIVIAEGVFDINAKDFVRPEVNETRFFEGGIDEGYLKYRLEMLKNLLSMAKERNMTKMIMY